MVSQLSLNSGNSSSRVKGLNSFLRRNGFPSYESYCRIYQDDRVLITVCYGDKDIGTIYFSENWKFSFLFPENNEILAKAIDTWIDITLNGEM